MKARRNVEIVASLLGGDAHNREARARLLCLLGGVRPDAAVETVPVKWPRKNWRIAKCQPSS